MKCLLFHWDGRDFECQWHPPPIVQLCYTIHSMTNRSTLPCIRTCHEGTVPGECARTEIVHSLLDTRTDKAERGACAPAGPPRLMGNAVKKTFLSIFIIAGLCFGCSDSSDSSSTGTTTITGGSGGKKIGIGIVEHNK